MVGLGTHEVVLLAVTQRSCSGRVQSNPAMRRPRVLQYRSLASLLISVTRFVTQTRGYRCSSCGLAKGFLLLAMLVDAL
jgi:hypothetical protein